MSSKKKFPALFLSFMVSLIHAGCWMLLSFWMHPRLAFSASAMNSPGSFPLFYSFLFIFVPFIFVFMLMKTQANHLALTQAQLKNAEYTFEDRMSARTAELEKTMGEIKTLKGIITICANCKSIRNSKGQWETVESYIQRHTEAQFSHGLCNECQYALYGEKYSNFKSISNR